ncbi:Clp protease N-terminal domain-containing protein [Actinomadura sp. ATCC 31491]|uniref:Clp protease N-terminal domain-containing protein n=1 Tax=Actinomadura luzonensis TaxID=2805427 RepID=A0ABT0G0A3_9ACTN|nr:Clp protease N-terminal domain-containing protein [Actinomadura luzonensis]MCK2218021.1 Clp protease N-terminal domain-containing protein [Actinomadura luzonensis]
MTTPIVRAAHDQAAAAGDDWVSPLHVVLALLAEDSLAARVLREAGLDRARALKVLRHGERPGHGAGGFANPAFHTLYGVARGLALAAGHRAPGPEHWLLALAYDAWDREATTLHVFGVDPAGVVAALRAHGVATPPLDPPAHVPWRGRHQVVVPAAELRPLLDRLNAEHPAGSEWRWGWNWVDDDMGRAVVTAEEGIDLAPAAGGPSSGGRPSAPGGSPGSPGGGRA